MNNISEHQILNKSTNLKKNRTTSHDLKRRVYDQVPLSDPHIGPPSRCLITSFMDFTPQKLCWYKIYIILGSCRANIPVIFCGMFAAMFGAMLLMLVMYGPMLGAMFGI